MMFTVFLHISAVVAPGKSLVDKKNGLPFSWSAEIFKPRIFLE
jgi:hypothetical protein